MKVLQRISELIYSRAISHVTDELKINVAEIFSVSIIRVVVVNDRISLKLSQFFKSISFHHQWLYGFCWALVFSLVSYLFIHSFINCCTALPCPMASFSVLQSFFKIGASSNWCIKQYEGGIILCAHPSDFNSTPCSLTWCPFVEIFCFLFFSSSS